MGRLVTTPSGPHKHREQEGRSFPLSLSLSLFLSLFFSLSLIPNWDSSCVTERKLCNLCNTRNTPLCYYAGVLLGHAAPIYAGSSIKRLLKVSLE